MKHGGSTLDRALRAAEAYFGGAGPPLVLVLDDLDRADRESRLLAEALIAESVRRDATGRKARGIAILVASTGDPPPSVELAGWRPSRGAARRGACVLCPLEPLPLRAAGELLERLLRPLGVSRKVLRKLARSAHGVPLRLRQLSRAILERFGKTGSVPDGLELDRLLEEESGSVPRVRLDGGDPIVRAILTAFAVLQRPLASREVATATGRPPEMIRRALQRLVRDEILAVTRRGTDHHRLYHLDYPEIIRSMAEGIPRREIRRIHARVLELLQGEGNRDLPAVEDRARHLLVAGGRPAARKAVLEAVDILEREGWIQNGIRLLQHAAASERTATWRFVFADRTSALCDQAGDHEEGIAVLEPLLEELGDRLRPGQQIRLRRRLGVHYHRAGRIDAALKLFGEVRDGADPRRNLEDLVFVETELAELHLLRGSYETAERACERGLRLLEVSPPPPESTGTVDFRGSMEVMLRASLGHLFLRRLELNRAREELETASRLADSFSTPTTFKARIYNNLGIVHNHLNEFSRARKYYRRAEALLRRLGDRRGAIVSACNRATIAAKTGEAREARANIERAVRMVAQVPGKWLEFFVSVARGMVAQSLGDATAAIECFREAIPVGRELGDVEALGFAEIYLAEAQLTTGLYWEARQQLHIALEHARETRSRIRERMALGRLLCVEAILHRRRPRRAHRRALAATARTGIDLLEAWNDLFVALAADLEGTPDEARLRSALEAFERLGIPAGSRLARVGLLYRCLDRGEPRQTRFLLESVRSADRSHHPLLSILEPLACAEAELVLGELDPTETCLREATGAIVGQPYLEPDWRIEFLRARVAERRGDREEARRHLYRSLHTCELLARSLPRRMRERFLHHPRFSRLHELARKLRKPGPRSGGTELADQRGVFQGMIGQSPEMVEIFRTIDQLRDQEGSVLVTGETGTGKELVARAIHRTSPRGGGPLLVLHCATLPAELFESELFGYEEGAFTGADQSRPGLLVSLAGGTLLLDQVNSLSLSSQAKLLHVLDSRVIRPLGSLDTHPLDVRFIALSSVDLAAQSSRGTFRPDLYYRLAGVTVNVPPLRARHQDIGPLARHLLEKHARRLERPAPALADSGLEFLISREWPGNVRELDGVLLRALLTTSPGTAIDRKRLHVLVGDPSREPIFSDHLLAGRDLRDLRKELDRAYLLRLFRQTDGDLDKMTRVLGVKAANLYHWLKRVGIDIRELRRQGRP